MKIKIDLLKEQKIKFEGVTDFGELYKYLKLWLGDNGYANERNLEQRDIEVEQNGVKRKMQKASYEFKVSSYLESTPAWDNLKGFQRIYYNLIMRKRINDYLEELYDKSAKFHSYIKELLGLRD